MEPLFVPTPRGQLFGWLHEPEQPRSPAACVVLCNPFGQEYVLAHRALQALGKQLARAGYFAVRFDWFASGDSAGDAGDVSLAAWREDLDLVIAAALERTRAKGLALVGLRLGGSLALEHAARDERVRALALWDPVLDGPEYLEELERGHHDRPMPGARKAVVAEGPLTEIAGFALPAEFQSELTALGRCTRAGACPVLVASTRPDPRLDGCIQEWVRQGAKVEQHDGAGQHVWEEVPGTERTLVPLKLLNAMVAWLEGVV